MENLRVREAAPTSVNVTVARGRREYLTEREVERLIEAAKQNRSGHRDATAILVAYRHGLRASEVVALRWEDIDLTTGRLHVRRAKGGDASVHPISARESRALRKLLREAPTSPYVFISERRAPLSGAGYQRMVARAGVAAKFTFPLHSHMLRHACGVLASMVRAVLIGQGFQIGLSAAVLTLESNYFSRKSAHFCIWSLCPQGIIGTDEVECFGEPSMMRSE
jgi:integrase